jgi:hypothetical protein
MAESWGENKTRTCGTRAPYVEAAAFYNAHRYTSAGRGIPGRPMHQANAVDAGGSTGKAAGVDGPP